MMTLGCQTVIKHVSRGYDMSFMLQEIQECNPYISDTNTNISSMYYTYVYIHSFECIHYTDMFHNDITVRRHVWLQQNSLHHGKLSTSFGCRLPNASWSCFRGRDPNFMEGLCKLDESRNRLNRLNLNAEVLEGTFSWASSLQGSSWQTPYLPPR